MNFSLKQNHLPSSDIRLLSPYTVSWKKEEAHSQHFEQQFWKDCIHEWIDDQLEPITPIPISLRTKTFDPFLEAPPERPTLEYIISHQLPFSPLPVNQIQRATLLYGKILSYCKSLMPNIPCFLPCWPPAHFPPCTQAQLEHAILKCRTEANLAACWEIDKELHPPHIPRTQLSPSFFRHLAVRYEYPHPVTDLIKPAPLRHKWKLTS